MAPDPDKLEARLLRAYQSAVILAAKVRDLPHGDFGEASVSLPPEVFAELRKSFADQMSRLRPCSD